MNKWILGLAVIGLLVSCGEDTKEESKEKPKESTEKSVKIAYYDLEKMYTDLEFSVNAGKLLDQEMIAANDEYAKYMKQYESSIAIMEDPNASVDQQIAADRRMQQAQQKLAQLQQASGYQMKQMQLEQQLGAYLFKYSEEYAKQIGVDVMFMNAPGGVIAYINKGMDVTDEFIKFLDEKIAADSSVQPLAPNAQGQPVPGQTPTPVQ